MSYSVLKDLNANKRIGEKLKSRREQLNWRLSDVAKKTGIKIDYLLALEEEHFEKIPNGLYAKKYLRKYTKLLKLPLDKIDQQFSENEYSPEVTTLFGQKTLNKNQLLAFPKIIRRFSLILVVLLCSLYLLLYFKKMFFPPEITIYSPTTNLITKESSILVSGKVAAEADLKINDESVPKDQQNVFSKKISLKKGLNHLIIKAKRKYSQEKVVTIQILVE